jgi:hypothetical protein
MKPKNHRITSNFIYQNRREEFKRIIHSGSSLPVGPSVLDKNSTTEKSQKQVDSSSDKPKSR